MSISLPSVAEEYLATKKLSSGSCKEYRSTVTKWIAWGNGVAVDQIGRAHLRDFLDWDHEKAASDGGSNAGQTANKARENLRAILSWAWEQDYLEKLPRFPKPKPQRDVAGRHYLTKSDLNALYFATYELKRPRGWKQPFTVGHYWRAALVVFFNYGVDSDEPGPLAIALLVNTGLMILLGLQHSVMARPGFKDAWIKVIPPASERSTYVLLSGVVFILICFYWQAIAGTFWHVEVAQTAGLNCLFFVTSVASLSAAKHFG